MTQHSRLPNPLRLLILGIAHLLGRFGLVDEQRARRTTDLAWPRIVTGIARKSKTAIDIAMVGIAVGPAAIAGIGFAGPYWGLAFTMGGGIATGAIALISQRFGAEAYDQIGQAVRTSSLLVVAATVPITVVLALFPAELIGVLTDDQAAINQGAAYLQIVAFGVPFAGLNLIGGRVLIGADDAWTPMVLRASGAVAYIGLSAVLIFGLQLGSSAPPLERSSLTSWLRLPSPSGSLSEGSRDSLRFPSTSRFEGLISTGRRSAMSSRSVRLPWDVVRCGPGLGFHCWRSSRCSAPTSSLHTSSADRFGG